MQQLAHAALGVGNVRRLRDPMADLLRRLKAVEVELFGKLLELRGGQVGLRPSHVPRAQGAQAAVFVAVQPIMDAVFTGQENSRNIPIGSAVGFEEDALETVTQPNVLFGFVATDEFVALVVGQGEYAFHAYYCTP